MLRPRGHILHGHWRSCGHLSRKGEALLRLVLYLFALFSWCQSDSGQNLGPDGLTVQPTGDVHGNLDPNG